MNEPIHVLEVFHGMDCGGAENMIMNLYRRIDREKVQFDFLVHTEKACFFDNEIRRLGGRIITVPYFNGLNYKLYVDSLKKVFLNYPEVKVVHGHLGSCSNIYLRVANEFNKFTIAHSHNTKPSFSLKNLAYRINTFQVRGIADFFIGCSDAAGLYRFGKRITDNPDRYITLKNAIDTDLFRFNAEIRNKIRTELQLKDKIVLGHVGRFNEQKNHTYLIRILEQLVKVEPQATLVLVGDGNLKDNISLLINEKGLENHVLFLGLRSDVNELLQGMDCFVFPSLYEGLPVTVIEAQAAGLPCVISDTITKEVKQTDLVKFISIDQDPDVWVKPILDAIKNTKRSDRKKEIERAGYDIGTTTQWITDFYIKASQYGR